MVTLLLLMGFALNAQAQDSYFKQMIDIYRTSKPATMQDLENVWAGRLYNSFDSPEQNGAAAALICKSRFEEDVQGPLFNGRAMSCTIVTANGQSLDHFDNGIDFYSEYRPQLDLLEKTKVTFESDETCIHTPVAYQEVDRGIACFRAYFDTKFHMNYIIYVVYPDNVDNIFVRNLTDVQRAGYFFKKIEIKDQQ